MAKLKPAVRVLSLTSLFKLEFTLLHFLNLPAIQYVRYSQSLLALCIFFYAGLSPFNPDEFPLLAPTFLHIFGNFCLICSLWLAFFHRVSLVKLVIAACLISISCELAQSLTQSRHTNTWDFLCNIFGIGIGAATCGFIYKWLHKNARMNSK